MELTKHSRAVMLLRQKIKTEETSSNDNAKTVCKSDSNFCALFNKIEGGKEQ